MISVKNGLETPRIARRTPAGLSCLLGSRSADESHSFSFSLCVGVFAPCWQILLLNGWHDREISGYTATDCVNAVCSSLNRRESGRNGVLTHSPSEYITHVLVPRHGSVYDPSSDLERLSGLGVRVVEVDSFDPEGNGQFRFETQALVEAIDGIVSPRGAG
mmetsp:Transcript_7493/g.21551  ORF Transcript_7493/g.21551 Transcript_7493/m.21551 type:complete len:161 (+) Transcript_7493:169-651(+)